MAFFRVPKNRNYTVMSNHHLRNKELSLKAKGLFSLILSLPDTWDFTLRGLVKICKENKEAVRTALNELINAGYIIRTQGRDENGKMSNNIYDVYEIPCTDKPSAVNPHTVNPISENPFAEIPKAENQTQLNMDKEIIERVNTDDIKYQSINQNGIETIEVYRWIIHQNISYDTIVCDYDKEQVDELVEIMLECICSTAPTQRVDQSDVPTEVVKSRLLKIDSGHIEYVLDSLKANTTDVRNIKAYLKTVLYNAPVTINNYYSAKVNHDLYGTD